MNLAIVLVVGGSVVFAYVMGRSDERMKQREDDAFKRLDRVIAATRAPAPQKEKGEQ